MVSASYMEARPPRPSAMKRFIDQQVVPAAIDAAGTMEAGMERVATAVRERPATTLGLALALGAVLPFFLLMARPRRRRLFR